MNILIHDVGGSFTKTFVYNDKMSDFVSSTNDKTYLDSLSIKKRCFEHINFYISNIELDGIIITSFSNSVVCSLPGADVLRYATDSLENWIPADYLKTGYTSFFPKVSDHVRYFEYVSRYLPVSGYLASQLCDIQDWRGWDWTHASNSGDCDIENMQWLDDVFDIPILSPGEIIGNYKGIPVLLGGHDTTFSLDKEPKPFISTGTWTTFSQPCDSFVPIESERHSIRWLRDVYGNLHRQMLLKSPPFLTNDFLSKASSFFYHQNKVVIYGPFADKFKRYVPERIIDIDRQHIRTAKFAIDALGG